MRRLGWAPPAFASRVGPYLTYLTVVLVASACTGADTPATERVPGGISVVDAEGHAVHLSQPARRIVSLVPSATLTLEAFGAGSTVVGRTDFDSTASFSTLPSVGGGLHPSIEAIAALDPDLVVRFSGAQDRETRTMLDALGIPHVAIRPEGITDIVDIVRVLGVLTGSGGAADSVADGMLDGLAEVRIRATGHPPVRVAYVLGGSPPWVSGAGTYIHEIIELAGGTNVFADLGDRYASVSPEQFLARDIAVVLTPNRATLDPRIVEQVRVVEVGGALELPGPGVVDAAREVARILSEVGR